MKKIYLWLLLVSAGLSNLAMAFDHQHSGWDRLLNKQVTWIDDGKASQVDYTGFQADSVALQRYLDSLSEVTQQTFEGWSRERQLAFLINAYNAFTIKLVLSKYPQLRSIKDLGSMLRSPWKKRFFKLLGKKRHLDDIEHGLIRAPGVYDEPRIHVAVVCASIGCPALRDEAFVAERLDEQLENSWVRFLSDKSRNRYDSNAGNLEVSKVFDWYREDFSKGYRGFTTLETVFAQYAELLADAPEDQQRVRDKKVGIEYLEYDWRLNDSR